MKILDLFDKYFLIMMIFQSFVVGVYDSANYKRHQKVNMCNKAKIISITIAILSLILYVASKIK